MKQGWALLKLNIMIQILHYLKFEEFLSLNWEKIAFLQKRMGFEPIGNSAHTTEFLAWYLAIFPTTFPKLTLNCKIIYTLNSVNTIYKIQLAICI